VSIRRAGSVLNFERSTYHYKSCRPSQAGLRKRIREIAETRVRYGYRRRSMCASAIGARTSWIRWSG
jgi:putative transposase